MKPYWTPLSAVYLPDPPALATPTILKMMLRRGRPAELIYAGDRMWPALRHGERIVVDPLLDGSTPEEGSVVLACPAGIPDVYRLERRSNAAPADAARASTAPANAPRSNEVQTVNAAHTAILTLDADPAGTIALGAPDLLGVVRSPRRSARPGFRALRRFRIDLAEALRGRPDPAEDPTDTVLSKYDAQAPFYATTASQDMDDTLVAWILATSRPGGRILVAGCGAGRECFVLARKGFVVKGVDFSQPMLDLARRRGERERLDVAFELADLRRHEEPAGSYAAIYFTYDVYSFLASAADRVDLLRRMTAWLEPGGAIFLSARLCFRGYDRVILCLQRLGRLGDRRARWGQSHSRYIAPDGSFRRAFVQVFGPGMFRREIAHAGLTLVEWRRNHGLVVPRSDSGAP